MLACRRLFCHQHVVRILSHTSAYVSIRQHTSAYASIRQHTSGSCRIRQHTSAYVSIRQHTSAYVSSRQLTSAYVSIRQHTPAYVGIRRHTLLVQKYWRASCSLRRCCCWWYLVYLLTGTKVQILTYLARELLFEALQLLLLVRAVVKQAESRQFLYVCTSSVLY
jgi:hypothetical protein